MYTHMIKLCICLLALLAYASRTEHQWVSLNASMYVFVLLYMHDYVCIHLP
jgi:hypothetical protein